MDYYKLKRDAFKDIEDYHLKGKSLEEIEYLINRRYGLSRKFIMQQLEVINAKLDRLKKAAGVSI